METSKTLYKLNNRGDVSWWKIDLVSEIDDTGFPIHHLTRSWGHQLPVKPTDNIISEDIEDEQKASAKMNSYINEQKERRGYTEEIPTAPPPLPMLAQEYKGKIPFKKVALQPKLDGIRCILSEEGLRSRRNTFFGSCPHIELYLPQFNHPDLPKGIKFDGELIIKNTPFNIIEGFVMRQTPDQSMCFKEIEYHVFDCVDLDEPFSVRIKMVEKFIQIMEEAYIKYMQPNHALNKHRYFSKKCPFKMVQTLLYEDDQLTPEELAVVMAEYRASGYEGVMIRNIESSYQLNYRSPNLLKLKEFQDDEFKIIGVVEGAKKEGILICQMPDGKTFRCSFRGNATIRQSILTHRFLWVGKMLKVEHEGYSEHGIPRCPVGVHKYDKERV